MQGIILTKEEAQPGGRARRGQRPRRTLEKAAAATSLAPRSAGLTPSVSRRRRSRACVAWRRVYLQHLPRHLLIRRAFRRHRILANPRGHLRCGFAARSQKCCLLGLRKHSQSCAVYPGLVYIVSVLISFLFTLNLDAIYYLENHLKNYSSTSYYSRVYTDTE